MIFSQSANHEFENKDVGTFTMNNFNSIIPVKRMKIYTSIATTSGAFAVYEVRIPELGYIVGQPVINSLDEMEIEFPGEPRQICFPQVTVELRLPANSSSVTAPVTFTAAHYFGIRFTFSSE